MQDIKDQIQTMLDEISSTEGTPRFDLSEDDGCTVSFGEGMMVRLQLRPHIPELDFTVPLGSVIVSLRALGKYHCSGGASTTLAGSK